MAVSPSSDVGVTGHVMISFHQSSKPVVLRLREKIRSAGYRIWMDIEGMLGGNRTHLYLYLIG
jgi:hypothetical protein